MIAPGLPAIAVHALLHHDPVAVVGDHEPVQVEVETVLHGGAVNLGHEPAGLGEAGAVETDPVTDGGQLLRRLSRVLPPAAANVDAKLARQWVEAALERAEDAGGDAR